MKNKRVYTHCGKSYIETHLLFPRFTHTFKFDILLFVQVVSAKRTSTYEGLCSFSDPLVGDWKILILILFAIKLMYGYRFDVIYFKYKLMIFLPHLVPYNTGQAPWRVNLSGSPVSWRLYQNIADPTVGLTPTPIRGKTVRPPAGTLFIYNVPYKRIKYAMNMCIKDELSNAYNLNKNSNLYAVKWNTIHDTQEPNDTYIEHQGCNTIPNEKLFFLFVKVY